MIGPEATAANGFHDITSEIVVRGVGATDPNWSQMGTSALYAYEFALDDQCWMAFHIPHDYRLGTGIYLHAHWTSNGTNVNIVKWTWTYAYSKGHNQAVFPITATTEVSAQEAAQGTAWRHMITETVIQTNTNFEPDGIIYCNIARKTNGGTDNTDKIFLLTADVHYQSTGLPTLNRSPNFYAS